MEVNPNRLGEQFIPSKNLKGSRIRDGMHIKKGRGYFFGPDDLSMSSSGSLIRIDSSFPDGSVVSSTLRWFPSTMVKDVNRNWYIQN